MGCTEPDGIVGARAGGFKNADGDKKAKIVSLMEKKGIQYIVDIDGYIIYLLKNQAEVLGIERSVTDGKILDPNVIESEVLIIVGAREKYESEFSKRNIPYKIAEYYGMEHISWSQQYAMEVDLIRQKVNIELSNLY